MSNHVRWVGNVGELVSNNTLQCFAVLKCLNTHSDLVGDRSFDNGTCMFNGQHLLTKMLPSWQHAGCDTAVRDDGSLSNVQDVIQQSGIMVT